MRRGLIGWRTLIEFTLSLFLQVEERIYLVKDEERLEQIDVEDKVEVKFQFSNVGQIKIVRRMKRAIQLQGLLSKIIMASCYLQRATMLRRRQLFNVEQRASQGVKEA